MPIRNTGPFARARTFASTARCASISTGSRSRVLRPARMLNYQSTSFHDGASLRQLFGFRPAPEFEAWLEEMGIMRDGKLTARAGDASVLS